MAVQEHIPAHSDIMLFKHEICSHKNVKSRLEHADYLRLRDIEIVQFKVCTKENTLPSRLIAEGYFCFLVQSPLQIL